MSAPPHPPASAGTLPEALRDRHGRRLTYLRLSVTGRCNLRCAYCRPAGGAKPAPACAPGSPSKAGGGGGLRELLTDPQIVLLAEAAASLGVQKLRLTGGEPLLRRDLPALVAALAAVPGLRRLALTTNGVLLAGLAGPLREAGLAQVNVSLDTLLPERFAALTGADRLPDVLAGIRAALGAGLEVKLNCIVLPGFNEDELPHLARLAVGEPLAVRFITHVPAPGRARDLAALGVRPEAPSAGAAQRIERRLAAELDLVPLPAGPAAGPAREFRIGGGAGRVGIISVLEPGLCRGCNRLRVTATGRLRGCLFEPGGLELGPLLRAGDRAGLLAALRGAAAGKPAGHGLDAGSLALPARMNEIGG